MSDRFRRVLIAALMLQCGCVAVTKSYRQAPAREATKAHGPAATEEPGAGWETPESDAGPAADHAPADQVPPATPPVALPESPPAIVALREEADASLARGELDNAATALERGIRIKPRDPELWHDLAQVRLRQEQPGLAEDLAKKSNLHAKGRPDLTRANWLLIAEARRRKGDMEGAAYAQQKADR
jgi:hypothetical protein